MSSRHRLFWVRLFVAYAFLQVFLAYLAPRSTWLQSVAQQATAWASGSSGSDFSGPGGSGLTPVACPSLNPLGYCSFVSSLTMNCGFFAVAGYGYAVGQNSFAQCTANIGISTYYKYRAGDGVDRIGTLSNSASKANILPCTTPDCSDCNTICRNNYPGITERFGWHYWSPWADLGSGYLPGSWDCRL
jgi:hypothetical protein